jgi:hypothetical protein
VAPQLTRRSATAVDETTMQLHVLCLKKRKTFSPSTFTKVRFSSLNSKTRQITSLNFSNRAFLPPWSGFEGGFATVNGGFAIVRRFCLFLFFLFISAESLKNHIKSQKNHKMKNPILLHST